MTPTRTFPLGTAAMLLHVLAGAPAMPACAPHPPTPCWVCGTTTTRGADRVRWEGANFQSQNQCRAPEAPIVCEPCVWACAWSVPPGFPPPPPGTKGLNLRLFSHGYDAGTYVCFTKAEKPALRAWLRTSRRGPWFCAIAASGQKHLLPWTPVNPGPGPGRIRFEEAELWGLTEEDWTLVDELTALLTLGVAKSEVATGCYRPLTWQRRAQDLRAFEARRAAQRHSRGWALALWLAQRENPT